MNITEAHQKVDTIHKCSVNEIHADILHQYLDEQHSKIEDMLFFLTEEGNNADAMANMLYALKCIMECRYLDPAEAHPIIIERLESLITTCQVQRDTARMRHRVIKAEQS